MEIGNVTEIKIGSMVKHDKFYPIIGQVVDFSIGGDRNALIAKIKPADTKRYDFHHRYVDELTLLHFIPPVKL